MTVNFLDKSAVMVGLDLHTFCPLVPPGAEVPVWPHLVGMVFAGPSMFWKFTKKSTTEARAMVQDGWSLILVPHIPYPAPPGPKEAVEFAMMIVTSSSEPLLSVGSVTGEGSSLTVCVFGCFGLNLNCGPFESDQITGAVICVNSVQTTPTLSDIVGAFIKTVATAIIAPLVGFLVGKGLGAPLKKLAAAVAKPLIKAIKIKLLKKIVVKAFRKLPKPLVEFIARFLTKTLADKISPAVKSTLPKGDAPVAQGIVNAMGI